MNVEQGESGDCHLQSLTAPPAFPLCLLASANSTMSDTTPPRLPLVKVKQLHAVVSYKLMNSCMAFMQHVISLVDWPKPVKFFFF